MQNDAVIRQYLKKLPDKLNPKMYQAILNGLCQDTWINCVILDLDDRIILPLANNQDSQDGTSDAQSVSIPIFALNQAVGRVVIQVRNAWGEAATEAGQLIAQSIQHRLERLYHEALDAQLTDIMAKRHRLDRIVEETCKALDQNAQRTDYWHSIAQFLDGINETLGFHLSLVLTQKADKRFKVRVTSQSASKLPKFRPK